MIVARDRIPITSRIMATIVGNDAKTNIGMAAMLDTMDSIGTVQNMPAVTGSVAMVAESVPANVSRRENPAGTIESRSFPASEKMQIPSVAQKERRNEASDACSGCPRTMTAQTRKSADRASVFSQGSAIIAKLAINAARIMGIPLPARSAYPQTVASIRGIFVIGPSRFASSSTNPAMAAIFPPLATTKCDNPLNR